MRRPALVLLVLTVLALLILAVLVAGCAESYTWQRRGQELGDLVVRFCAERPTAGQQVTFWGGVRQRAGSTGVGVLIACP